MCFLGRFSGHYEEQFFEIIFGLVVQGRISFKDFSFLLFGSGSHFVRRTRTICATLVEDIVGNITVKLNDRSRTNGS